MCKDCGCEGVHEHVLEDGTVIVHSHDDHKHDHDHNNNNGHDHKHDHDNKNLTVEIEKNILSANDQAAMENRKIFQDKNIVAINIISSPGSGKTALLEATLDRLKGVIPTAVLVGDQRSDNDAKRLEGRGAPVIQIETGDSCHINAEQISKLLPEVIKPETKILFIENVGNLVCPAAFDLGECFKMALLSMPEGEDKPIKYPTIFNQAKVIILSKSDLKPHLDWDEDYCRNAIKKVNPAATVFELSSKTETGLDAWIEYLKNLIK